jgi:aspartyl-tRNA(Asn)/glutamyl-tRNA(Gln) amidotransferase subunit C
MVTKEDIQNLANLARIDIQESEIESFRAKMEGVLEYVSEVQKITAEAPTGTPEVPAHHNAFREDGEPIETGKYTEAIIRNVPEKEGNYVKVRKIL